MMRDPAVPVERSADHRLFAAEVDVLLDTWEPWLFRTDGPGNAHLLYREDVGAIDATVPIKLYTDMYHWVDLHRLSVVLVDGVKLP